MIGAVYGWTHHGLSPPSPLCAGLAGLCSREGGGQDAVQFLPKAGAESGVDDGMAENLYNRLAPWIVGVAGPVGVYGVGGELYPTLYRWYTTGELRSLCFAATKALFEALSLLKERDPLNFGGLCCRRNYGCSRIGIFSLVGFESPRKWWINKPKSFLSRAIRGMSARSGWMRLLRAAGAESKVWRSALILAFDTRCAEL